MCVKNRVCHICKTQAHWLADPVNHIAACVDHALPLRPRLSSCRMWWRGYWYWNHSVNAGLRFSKSALATHTLEEPIHQHEDYHDAPVPINEPDAERQGTKGKLTFSRLPLQPAQITRNGHSAHACTVGRGGGQCRGWQCNNVRGA